MRTIARQDGDELLPISTPPLGDAEASEATSPWRHGFCMSSFEDDSSIDQRISQIGSVLCESERETREIWWCRTEASLGESREARIQVSTRHLPASPTYMPESNPSTCFGRDLSAILHLSHRCALKSTCRRYAGADRGGAGSKAFRARQEATGVAGAAFVLVCAAAPLRHLPHRAAER